MTQTNMLELAKLGDAKAIESLMNRQNSLIESAIASPYNFCQKRSTRQTRLEKKRDRSTLSINKNIKSYEQ